MAIKQTRNTSQKITNWLLEKFFALLIFFIGLFLSLGFFSYTNTDMDTILDRCIVDGFIYTRYFRMEGKVDEFTDMMFTKMFKRYISKYDYIFYTSPYDVALINDGERSMSESFRNKIIKLYEDLILDKYPNVFVLEGSVETRYNKMIEIMYHE